jgi:hypothetical protein
VPEEVKVETNNQINQEEIQDGDGNENNKDSSEVTKKEKET